jgi:cytochrome c biogenesis protein CcmG/thiol:disulfide interchange protein DsbE
VTRSARRPAAVLVAAALATLALPALLAGCGRSESGADGTRASGAAPAGSCAGTVSGGSDAAGTIAPGRPATASPALPDLTFDCLGDGEAVPLRTITGAPTVVNLWASWCQPCRQELPSFQRLAQAAAGSVRVVGVVTEDSADRARSLAADLGLSFPSLVDAGGRLRRELGVPALPVTALIAADGRLAHVYSGPPLEYGALRALVADRLRVQVRG